MKKKQYLYFGNLLVLSMLLLFTGCQQKEQTVEESPAPTGESSVVETPLPEEVTDNQLFYAEGMESISINEKDLTAGKEVDMTVQSAEGEEQYCSIGREKLNPQMKLEVFPCGEHEYNVAAIDFLSCLGEGFRNVLDLGNTPRSGFDYQMAWYDFNQDGKKELIFAGGDKKGTLACAVFQVELTDFGSEMGSESMLDSGNPPEKLQVFKTIQEFQGGVRAYVNDNNEICVVDGVNHIYKQTVNCQE